MAITVSFYDPDLDPKYVEVSTWAEVLMALEEENQTYTHAHFTEDLMPKGFATREVGERTWLVRREYVVSFLNTKNQTEVRRLRATDMASAWKTAERLVGPTGVVTAVSGPI